MRFLVVCLAACTTSLRVPPAIAPNVEREMLEEVVRGDAPPDDAVIFLVGEYLTEHRLHEGYEMFRARAARSPEVPLFEALDGFFEVQLAPEVTLLRREGYVNRALAKLDDAARRAPRSPARLFRAFVLARLPERFHRRDEAVHELEALTSRDANLPLIVRHDAYLALAIAYDNVGRTADSKAALARSGYPSLDGAPVALTTQISVMPHAGTRYTAPELVEEAPGVLAAYGFDYAEVYFVIGDTGVIAIDAGAVFERVRRIKQMLRERTQLPITHVILTHAHWDHAGGLAALVEPGTKVIANAHFGRTLHAMAPFDVDRQSAFLGDGGWTPRDLHVDVPVGGPCTHVLNNIEVHLVPLEGAETPDSLIVEVPGKHVVFAGDAIADLGIPFLDEGSTLGFIRALELLGSHPAGTRVLHGHRPIAEFFPLDRMPAFAAAFRELRDAALADIHAGLDEAEIVRRERLPSTIKRDPRLTVPFMMFREAFLRRLVHEETGYWAMNGGGLELATRGELGAAVDLVADHDPAKIASASAHLVRGGDFALAARLAELGLAAHPGDIALTRIQRAARLKLLERSERWDFFKLTVYAQLTGTWIPPVPR